MIWAWWVALGYGGLGCGVVGFFGAWTDWFWACVGVLLGLGVMGFGI